MKQTISEITTKQIQDIIENNVSSAQQHILGGGVDKKLVGADKAAKEIIELFRPSYKEGGFWG